MGGVLLLNATHEPLRVISLLRAVVLILEEKVDVVETEEERAIRSATMDIPYPRVLRLRYYVHIPFEKRIPLSNKNVLARDRMKCGYCGGKATTVDHIQPKSRGGLHEWENVVAACLPCNQRKGNKTLKELGWKLNTTPHKPRTKRLFVVGRIEESWEPYLSLTH